MTNGKTEAKGKDTVPLPYGSEAWVAFRTQIYPDFLVALSHGLEEPQKRALYITLEETCNLVRQKIMTSEVEPEFIKAAYPPYRGVKDETGFSGLIEKMIAKRIKGDFKENIMYRTPSIDYANKFLEHPDGENGINNFVFAIDSNNLRHIEEVSFTARPRHLLVGTPEATVRFLIGAAASFRSRNALRAAGPIIVAIGHWNFIEAINARALWGRDVTLQVDMPHLRDQAKAYLVDYIQPAVRRGQPVYFILQDAGEYLDITEQISSMANTADVQVALAAGVTAPRWNGANTQRGGVEPLQDLIRNATSVWFGKEKFPDNINNESERLGLPPGIAKRLTPHMMVQVAPGELSSSMKHTFLWPIGGKV